MIKLIDKPLSLLASVLGGILAGAIFKQIWKLAAHEDAAHEDKAPKATDARRGRLWILPAAALRGAVYGVVKDAVGRGAAEGMHKVTGVWPGDNGQQAQKAA